MEKKNKMARGQFYGPWCPAALYRDALKGVIRFHCNDSQWKARK